jgi:2-desacetyl-2-hydroxyethyl bacteriochlorophyllide A dehydrogenase
MNESVKIFVKQKLAHHRSANRLVRSIYHRKRIHEAKALTVYAKNKCAIEPAELKSPSEKEVLIKVLRIGINVGTERALFIGSENATSEYPYTPYSSGVGEIISKGKKVTDYKVGDLVAGPFQNQSQVTIDSSKVFKVLPGIELNEAALLAQAIISLQALRMGRVSKDSSVAVIGQGNIGRIATLLSRAIGARTICVSRTQERLIQVNEPNGIATETQDGLSELKQLNADIVLDATGSPEALETAVQAARTSGKVILLGSSRGHTRGFDFHGPVRKKKISILGAHMRHVFHNPHRFSKNFQEEGRFVQECILAGKLSLKSVITKTLNTQHLIEYYSDLEHSKDCGVVVDWSDSEQLSFCSEKKLVHYSANEYHYEKIKPALNIALVGCGGIGQINAKVIHEYSGLNLTAVADTNPESAEKIAKKFNVPHYRSIDTILSDRKTDAVFLNVPHHIHAPLAVQAANAGKHVLIEKPLASTLADSKKIIQAGIDNNVTIQTYLPFYFFANIRHAKDLIEQDALGKIQGFTIEDYRYRTTAYWYADTLGKYEENWRAKTEFAGGGYLIMNMVHPLEYILSITNIEVKSVFAKCQVQRQPVAVEDSLSVLMAGTKGESCTIIGGSGIPGARGCTIRIWGSQGQILCEDRNIKFFSQTSFRNMPANTWHQLNSQSQWSARTLAIRDFHKQLLAKAPTSFDERGYKVMKVIDAIYRSNSQAIPTQV